MKNALSLAFFCLFVTLQGQIVFEEVTSPDDFSLNTIRKSPIGEYFTQAINDRSTIYTSLDGEDWTQEILSDDFTLDEIQFYTDGTPVIKQDYADHFIRRDGDWRTLGFGAGWSNIEASFIKEDTLFAFEGNEFAYSLDKGISFVPLFISEDLISVHKSQLWVTDKYLVLYHTLGASDYLSVFTREGIRVMYEDLNINSPSFAFNTCGALLMNSNSNYYYLTTQNLSLTLGNPVDIMPTYSSGDEVFSANGDWYHRNSSSLKKTSGCDFEWETLLDDPLVLDNYDRWMSEDGDFLLTRQRTDRFIEYNLNDLQSTEKIMDIHYAYLYNVDESYQGGQVVTTPNNIFLKSLLDENWTENISAVDLSINSQYSPNGSLYINRNDAILFSDNNGQSFTTIETPESLSIFGISEMHVLDDGVIFMYGIIGGSFYTLDNGQNWVEVNFLSPLDPIKVALVDDDIIIAELGFSHTVTKVNIFTNETLSEDLGTSSELNYNLYTILADGTIYYIETDLFNEETIFYRYKFGDPLETVNIPSEINTNGFLISSGYDLFLFAQNEYYIFDGEDFMAQNYAGLPSEGYTSFWLANNQHLYGINNSNRLFRSTEPLSSPQFITGSIYHDDDQDCQPNLLDNKLAYWQVRIEGENFSRIKSTNSEGDYSFSVPLGDYTLSANEANSNWELCESSFAIAIEEDNATLTQDFQAKAQVECSGLELDFSTPLLRRCFDNYYTVQVRNTGPLASAGTTLRLVLDPFFDFLSASIPYTQINETEIEFDLGVLAVNETIVFNLEFNLSCEAELGQEHCLSGLLNDVASCPSFQPYNYTECQMNIGSFDPNDKRIFNEDGLETESVDLDEYIYYHIRFQNTGTDTAFQVRIVDPLSPILDLSTLVMLSASHPYEYSVNDAAALEVIFDDILLPDSTTNELASHGFFKFKIKPLAAYGYGTIIPNQAGIYFDFNEPVITNEAILLIQDPLRIREPLNLIRFQVFPNPTANELSIFIDDNYLDQVEKIELVSSFGQTIKKANWPDGQKMDVAMLPSGIYQVLLKSKGIIIGVEKFVKL